jgi:hypothetical protein
MSRSLLHWLLYGSSRDRIAEELDELIRRWERGENRRSVPVGVLLERDGHTVVVRGRQSGYVAILSAGPPGDFMEAFRLTLEIVGSSEARMRRIEEESLQWPAIQPASDGKP